MYDNYSIFNDWFDHCFAPAVENYLKNKNLVFKLLLLLDNAPSHLTDLSHPNVQIEFLPPNTTSLLQPLDQTIIAAFKAYYIPKSFELIYEDMESAKITSLKDIHRSILKAHLMEIDVQGTISTPIEDELKNIVRWEPTVEGDRFVEIKMADIQELHKDTNT